MRETRKKRHFAVILCAGVLLLLILVLWQTENSRKRNEPGKNATEAVSEIEAQTQEPLNLETENQENPTGSNQQNGQTQSDFYSEPLTDDVKQRITGISFPQEVQSNIAYEDLAYVHVLHYDFNHQIQEGELICNQFIAEDLTEIFEVLYENEYPIGKIRLIDEYGGDDEASMEDNNTSCFNYRAISGGKKLSNHSYGCAIDINPLYNPYVKNKSDGSALIQPVTAEVYTDRTKENPYAITKDDLCFRLFTEHGFTWGGDWSNPKDYQHFEKEK